MRTAATAGVGVERRTSVYERQNCRENGRVFPTEGAVLVAGVREREEVRRGWLHRKRGVCKSGGEANLVLNAQVSNCVWELAFRIL